MTPAALFPDPPTAVVCAGCGSPRELDASRCSPGVLAYKTCAACHCVGVVRAGDRYRSPQLKRPTRDAYERSRYRGGQLAPTPRKEQTP